MTDYAEIFSKLQAPSILESAQKALALQAAAQGVQANRLQLEARGALGPILQSAIDPKTGELDYKKAFVGMAGNPATAWMAPDFLDKAVARQGTQAETFLKELDANKKQVDAVHNVYGGLLPLKNAVTRADVANGLRDEFENGRLDKEHYLGALGQLNHYPESGPALANYAKQVALRAKGASESLDKVYQNITAREQGGETVFTQESPLEQGVRQVPVVGPAAKAGALPKTLTPEKKAELVEGIDERGGKVKRPYGELFPSSPSAAPAGSVGGGGASASGGAPATQGVRTQLSPQVEKAWEKMGENYDKIVALGQTNQGVEYALDTAEDLLKRYTPNAAADVREKVAAGLSAIGISDDIVNKVGSGSLPAGQVFKSVMLDLATNRMKKALEGGGRFTNIEFQTFNQTKPNPNMSAQAVRELIQYYRRGIQLDKMYIRGYNHFLDQGKSPTEFENWWQDRLDSLQERRKAGRG